MHYHRTALCPHCGKDSYESEWEATFVPVQCIWCQKWFMYKPGKGVSIKVKGKKDKR